MKSQLIGILIVGGVLCLASGCGDDNDNRGGGTRPTNTAVPAATNTAPPAATNTAPPAATNTSPPAATDTAPPAPTDTAPPAATDTPAAASPTPTPTEEPSAGLGERVFSVVNPGGISAPPSASRTGLFTTGLAGNNVLTGASGSVVLVGGALDENGVASLTIKEDATIKLNVLDGSFVCMKLFAEGAEGTIDCDGGTSYDVEVEAPSGDTGPDFELRTGLGDDAGPGGATIILMVTIANFPAGSPADICETGEFADPDMTAITTANATGIKGTTVMLNVPGENFDCDTWQTEDGPGMLSLPTAAFQTAAGGDVASIFRIADGD